MSHRNGSNGTAAGNGQPAEPLAPSDNGRDSKTGRFVVGYKGGPGNPAARQAAALKASFLRAATPAKLTELAEKLLSQALAGDVTASQLFLAYALGKPKAEPDAD